jgi:hypothetical protein
MKKLYFAKELCFSPKKVFLISDFINFCISLLPLSSDEIAIYLTSSREDYNIKTTAYYAPGNNLIVIYCKGRALVDVLRSIAHEMTHMMQDEQGLLTGHIQDAGGFHEDQANAKAGELIKLFAKSNPKRKAIYEGIKKRKILGYVT